MDTLRDSQVKARKPHRCCWCSEPILAGETHQVYVNVDGGEVYNCRLHAECHQARCASDVDEWDDGMFRRGSTAERGV